MSKKTLKNLINIEMGDTGGDGHSQMGTFPIHCNFTAEQLEDAYRLGVKLTKVDLINKVETGDGKSPQPWLNKLIPFGGNFDVDEEGFGPEGYLQAYMLIAKAGNPALEWENAEIPTIEIGGYGLFGN